VSAEEALRMTTNYDINYEPLFHALQLIDVQRQIDGVTEQWHNETLIQVGDMLVRLGVLHGEFHWHKHDGQDEFFFVLDGSLRIELENAQPVELGPRQAFSVPAGMLHRPVARERTTVIMLERAGVVPTGD
jgi:mannose-6-phosphate isomerase-like protein (cupin superfamily)